MSKGKERAAQFSSLNERRAEGRQPKANTELPQRGQMQGGKERAAQFSSLNEQRSDEGRQPKANTELPQRGQMQGGKERAAQFSSLNEQRSDEGRQPKANTELPQRGQMQGGKERAAQFSSLNEQRSDEANAADAPFAATRVLGIIPARRGSKGLPRKNAKLLNGKPLIAYTIEAAIAADNVHPIVTTDDPRIIEIAQDYGIDCGYRRPPDLAQDATSMAPVVLDALDWLETTHDQTFDAFVLLQPTSPLRTSLDIERAVQLLNTSDCPSVVGVSPMWTHPYECVEIMPDGNWSYLAQPSKQAHRRQDFEGSFYFINGAIYAVRTDAFKARQQFVEPTSLLLPMDEVNTIDIDSARDFLIAETLMDQLAQPMPRHPQPAI